MNQNDTVNQYILVVKAQGETLLAIRTDGAVEGHTIYAQEAGRIFVDEVIKRLREADYMPPHKRETN